MCHIQYAGSILVFCSFIIIFFSEFFSYRKGKDHWRKAQNFRERLVCRENDHYLEVSQTGNALAISVPIRTRWIDRRPDINTFTYYKFNVREIVFVECGPAVFICISREIILWMVLINRYNQEPFFFTICKMYALYETKGRSICLCYLKFYQTQFERNNFLLFS